MFIFKCFPYLIIFDVGTGKINKTVHINLTLAFKIINYILRMKNKELYFQLLKLFFSQ